MWQPDRSWSRLAPTGDGARVWRAQAGDRPWVVKRLWRPDDDGASDDALDPGHAAWWRREADVLEHGWARDLPGLRDPGAGHAVEDADGVTLWTPEVSTRPVPPEAAAWALGRLSAASVTAAPWLCQDLVGDRLSTTEAAGGWDTLALTPAGQVSAALWERRHDLYAEVRALPQVPHHGDVTPGNLLRPAEDHVVACDWSTAGLGPVGADLGYLGLMVSTPLDVLVDAFLAGAADGGAVPDRDAVLTGARVMASFTVVTRADRVLRRVRGGEGDWPSKMRHPAMAPTIRALQRAYTDFAPLLRD